MVKEIKGMSINPGATAEELPDTDIEWYDFGGGVQIAPSVPPVKLIENTMVALHCTKEGKFFFKVFEGNDIKEEDLPELYEKYASIFKKEVEEKLKIA